MQRAIAATVITLALASWLPTKAETARVIDGDTIALGNERVRLWGIDAPEASQTCAGASGERYECGRDSTAVLVELTRGQDVKCQRIDTDRYGRTVSVCYAGGKNLNEEMVRRGWAVDYTRYSHGAYTAAEAAARAAKLGIWAGRFELPEHYRRQNRH